MDFILSVTELNEYVHRSLSLDPLLRDVRLRGEISGFKRHVSGHWYFTLKDEASRIDCVMFRQHNAAVRFEPRDGVRVVARGAAGLYTASGRYQFYAEGLTEDGMGDMYRRLEERKQKLSREGLFDEKRKRPLPLLPRRVGVVTSRTGAVIHDIATVTRRRCPGVQLILRPAKVQGEGAAEDIARGIEEVSALGVDVVIVGRGGGSLEDLWAFNEEMVVRAIAACPVPVVSAVGHEVDWTLADLAADRRAATPSQAAEMTVPQREDMLQRVADLQDALQAAAAGRLAQRRQALSGQEKRLALLHPLAHLRQLRQTARECEVRLEAAMARRMTLLHSRLTATEGRLDALGPRKALERGYAVLLDRDRAVGSIAELPEEGELILRDGRARVRVLEKKAGDPFAT